MKLMQFMLVIAILFAVGCAKSEAPSTADAPAPVPAAAQSGTPADDTGTAAFSNMTISVRRDAETVSERAIVSEEEAKLVQEIVFDYMAKSAAWEGLEVSELEECITLSFDWTADAPRQSYYQYESDGRHVLQAGEAGMYSIMSDAAYEKLMQLAGLSAERQGS